MAVTEEAQAAVRREARGTAVAVTSTRPDNLTAMMRARRRIGPVAIFDPQHLTEGMPAGMR